MLCLLRAQTQEAPSFLVPAGLLAAELARPAHSAAPAYALCPSTALLGCFMVHYLHRAFVYPLLVQRGGKPSPAPIWLMALAFCTYNGLMQVQEAHAGAPHHLQNLLVSLFTAALWQADAGAHLAHAAGLLRMQRLHAGAGTRWSDVALIRSHFFFHP